MGFRQTKSLLQDMCVDYTYDIIHCRTEIAYNDKRGITDKSYLTILLSTDPAYMTII
jgi:hypothetical protein